MTKNQGSSSSVLVRHGNRFISSGKFLFVGTMSPEQEKNEDYTKIKLMVSSDGGRNFNPAELPETLNEKGYTILDTSEDVVVMQVVGGGGSV